MASIHRQDDTTTSSERERFVSADDQFALTVEEITVDEHFASMQFIWNEILEKSDSAVLYLMHEWLHTWWQCHREKRKSLFILLVREINKIIGIAPFMLVKETFMGVPVKKIEFISMMKHAFSVENCSASLDFIITKRREEVICAIVNHLMKCQQRWDMIRLNPIPCVSKSLVVFERECQSRGLAVEKQMIFSNACLHVQSDWNDYLSRYSSDTLKAKERMEKKYREVGNTRFSIHQNLEDVQNGFDAIRQIEQRSWKAKKGVHIDAPVYRGFYHRLAECASSRGWLRLSLIEVNGVKIAYDLCVQYGSQVESLKTSYDITYKNLSPGVMITWKEFEAFFRDDVRKINLLWGDPDGKTRWAPELEEHDEVLVFGTRLYSRILYLFLIRLLGYKAVRFIEKKFQ